MWVGVKEYVLLNATSTPVKCSPSSRPNISWLMSRMEELEIPVAYSNGLEELYFTKLKGDHGEYQAGKIRIACDAKTEGIMDKVFIHELAHHVDDQEDVTSNDRLIYEKKYCAKYMIDVYARRNIYEYFAVGFEVYYLGAPAERKKMRRYNPHLYRTITKLHRQFSRK